MIFVTSIFKCFLLCYLDILWSSLIQLPCGVCVVGTVVERARVSYWMFLMAMQRRCQLLDLSTSQWQWKKLCQQHRRSLCQQKRFLFIGCCLSVFSLTRFLSFRLTSASLPMMSLQQVASSWTRPLPRVSFVWCSSCKSSNLFWVLSLHILAVFVCVYSSRDMTVYYSCWQPFHLPFLLLIKDVTLLYPLHRVISLIQLLLLLRFP